MSLDKGTMLNAIRLVAFDVDGVLTDGRLYYGADGESQKVFHVRDGVALKVLPDVGIEVAVVSAKDSPALRARLNDLGVKHAFLGCHDKLQRMQTLAGELALAPHQVAFVGDDLVDLEVMRWCGCGLAPADAYSLVQERADQVLPVKGGQGVARCVADLILKAQGLYEQAYTLAADAHFERQRDPSS
ncbi:KdsC family phosphatase [Saccharospirillum impatiens]|uniref:KdsC family phosphatase n=1 Tax=Saccharospirillum impatiens TaxID=169438 RepID=UPI00040B5B68|nr:HAD-IIIA family hydrolase [Saccharospirillum impatiens]